jgi:hypothetical protein
MPALLLHLTAIERLAIEAGGLPSPIARALTEDLPYARFGAALADLSRFRSGVGLAWLRLAPGAPFSQRVHEGWLPFGLKLAELVATGALVGREAGRAVVAGYFCHACVDLSLANLERAAVAHHRRADESEAACRDRLEWAQALFFAREIHGHDMAGQPGVREKFQLLKHPGLPWRGVGRGLYELVRLPAQEELALALDKSELDSWVRGAYLFGAMLGSPLGRSHGIPAFSALSERELYAGVFAAVEQGLANARAVLGGVGAYMDRGRFGAKARQRVVDDTDALLAAPLPAAGMSRNSTIRGPSSSLS